MARPRQVSDTQILEAARACFLDQGASVSTTVIAERLGVSQAALFKRFGTKEGLLLAALRPDPSMLDGLMDQIEAGPTATPVPEQLRGIALSIRDAFALILPRMAVLRSAGMGQPSCADTSRPIPPQRVHKALQGWLERAGEQGLVTVSSPSAAAFALLGAIHMQCFMAYMVGTERELASDEALGSLVESLWVGLSPREVSP